MVGDIYARALNDILTFASVKILRFLVRVPIEDTFFFNVTSCGSLS